MKTGKEQSAYRKPGDGSGPSQVMVYTEYAEFEAAADALAEKLAVPFCSDPEQAQSFVRSDLLLHLTKEGLCLEGAGLRLLPEGKPAEGIPGQSIQDQIARRREAAAVCDRRDCRSGRGFLPSGSMRLPGLYV